jgi:polysaccharide biosynthesis/export protein
MNKKIIFNLVLCFQLIAAGWAGNGYCQDTKEDAETYYKLGQTYYDQGRYKEAEELFQKSVNILSRVQENKEKQTPQPVKTPVQEARAETPAVRVPALPSAQFASQPVKLEYLIGEEDVLHISVWQNQDLDTEAVVRPDGMISVPLVGDITATGLSITQLSRDVTQRLAEFVREPQVSVSIRKIGGKRVIVLGQVVTPGVINVGGAMRVMDAIGMSGGFTRDAVPSSTVVIRGGFDGAKARKLNLSKVFKGDLAENIALQSQDIIFVPRKLISDVNYFLEQVLQPLSQGVYTAKELRSY